MATLTSLLARDGVVPLDVIEQALQRQVLEGGELDTAVLELTSVPENVLASYRAASYGLAPASREDLERADARLALELSAELAREHRVTPIARTSKELVLAGPWPLQKPALDEIERHTGLKASVRIGTELRTHVALARCYGDELPARLARLRERLDDRSPGATLDVHPPDQPSQPPARRERTSDPEPQGAYGAERATQAAASEPDPNARATAAKSARRREGTDDELPPPVRVVPVVRLGGSLRPSQTRAIAGLMEASTPVARPSRPSRVGGVRGRISAAPRGPLTQPQAMELLGRAQNRDRVLDAFFSFARQYFACAVLFALREEHLLGLEASGLPELDVRALDLPMPRTGSVQAAVNERSAQVLDLTATAADRALAQALSRAHAQPCAMIPIAIRQRIVAVLYGDRGGEALQLEELAPLLDTLPAVSSAFERIIQQHKLLAVAARDEAQRAAPAPGGAGRPVRGAGKATPSGALPAAVRSGQTLDGTPVPPPERAESAPTMMVPRAPRVPADLAREAEELDRTTAATQQLPATRPSQYPPPSARPSERPAGNYSLHPGASEEAMQPPRGSRIPPAPTATVGQPAANGQAAGSDPPPPRTLSHAPPGAGAYSVSADIVERAGASKRPPPPAQAPSPAAASSSSADLGNRDPRRQTVPRRKSKGNDPRREREGGDGDGSARHSAEVVSIPKAVRESLLPPATPPDVRPEPSIVVDLGTEALRLLEELIRVGPDEDGRVLSQLVRLGRPALPIIAKRFPGPMWFDRHRPRKRLPLGREISAAARALHAFADEAVPFVAELLESKAADARFAATLLAGDLVRPALLGPLEKRLFDPDGQVRLIALETLPAYRNVAGFDDMLKSLRQRVLDEREPPIGRLPALEALGALRDRGSAEVLARLTEHASRQLSVPARRSLIAITGQDFEGERKWKAWLDKNKGRHRVEWLIDGLMHAEERVRATAGLELQKLTNVYYGFEPAAGRREREQAQTRYRNWWVIEGKRAFGAM